MHTHFFYEGFIDVFLIILYAYMYSAKIHVAIVYFTSLTSSKKEKEKNSLVNAPHADWTKVFQLHFSSEFLGNWKPYLIWEWAMGME